MNILKNLVGKHGALVVVILLAIQLVLMIVITVRENDSKKQIDNLKERVTALESRSQ